MNKENKLTKSSKSKTREVLIYNPFFVIIIGTLFAVYAGAILIAIDLYRVNKKYLIWIIIPISIIFALLEQIALNYYGFITTPMSFPINLIGIYLLKILFWDKAKPKNIEFSYRNIWIPLLIALIIWGPWYYYFFKDYIF